MLSLIVAYLKVECLSTRRESCLIEVRKGPCVLLMKATVVHKNSILTNACRNRVKNGRTQVISVPVMVWGMHIIRGGTCRVYR